MWATVLVSALSFITAVNAEKEVISIGRRKFTVHNEPKTWEMAVQTCKSENGHLATIMEDAEIMKLSSVGRRLPLWVGGRWLHSGWSWLHLGVPVTRPVPKPLQQNHCLRIATQGGSRHSLVGHVCSARHAFVCEIVTERGDQRLYDGVQYTVFNNRMPWSQAMDFCSARSATLAAPTNYRHARFLAALTRKFHELWLGAQSSKRGWRWRPSGEPLGSQRPPNLYPPWATPPPSTAGLCLSLTRGPVQIPVFLHANCSSLHNFVCQKPAWGPAGWRQNGVELEGRMYAFRPQPATWKRARRDCQQLGAEIAVMPDYNTSVLIAEQARYVPQMWLGGLQTPTGWTWASTLEPVPLERKGRTFPTWNDPVNRNLPGHRCLAVDVRNPDRPMFVPSSCTKAYVYACERADREYQHYIKMLRLRDRQLILVEEKRNFDEALKFCIRYNGALATLNKPHLLRAVKPYIKKFGGLWLGARSDGHGVVRWLANGEEASVLEERSLVLWEEDTEVVVTHDQFSLDSRHFGDMADLAQVPVERFRFSRQVPSGRGPDKNRRDVCMQLSKRGVFVESACIIKRSFACESRANISQIIGEKLVLGNTRYIAFNHKVSWKRADDICKDNRAKLAQLKPTMIKSLNQLQKVYEDLWMGARLEGGQWRWSDSSAVRLQVLCGGPCAQRRCGGVLRLGPHQPVQLHAWDCSEQHGFLCRLPA